MTHLTSTHIAQIEAARERYLRQTQSDMVQNEIRVAKQVQQQTGCSWTEALRVAYRTTTSREGAVV